MSERPNLRGRAKARSSPYPLGEFPDDVIVNIGRQIVHRLAVGHANIEGNDFADIFATAISGHHKASPIGVTDITWENCSWSAKTVQATKPFTIESVRLISGRNSPDYSYDIPNPRENLELTGEAVLNVWNERVNTSLNEHDDLRIVTLVRNMSTLEFTLFEDEAARFVPANYEWRVNKRRNIEGFDKVTGSHSFTWQPHGSQFTIIKHVPGSAYRFRIKKHPGIIERHQVLQLVGFSEDWIIRVGSNGKPSTHGEGKVEEHDAGTES